MCDGRWTPPYTDQTVASGNAFLVSSDRNAEETWLQRDRTESVCSSARRASQARSHRDRGTEEPAIQAGRLAQSRGSWALDRTYLPTSRSDSGAMQILANTDEHVDAVPDLVERVRNEILKSLSRFSQRVTRVEVHLSDQNADRGGNEFGTSRATGRVVSAFRRRGSFEVTVLDGRPLSCRGWRG
jgi:hypothetical protein